MSEHTNETSERRAGRAWRDPLHALRVADFMSTQLVRIKPDDCMDSILRGMVGARASCVVVVGENEAPLGLITERELGWYLAWVRSGAVHTTDAVRAVRARTLMQRDVAISRVDESMSTALERTRAREVREIIVVDDGGGVVGLVMQMDLFSACSRLAVDDASYRSPEVPCLRALGQGGRLLHQPVSMLLRRDVIHLSPADPIQEAIDLMAQGRISCILITVEMRPVGILTERDVILLNSVAEKPFMRARTLSDVMQGSLRTIGHAESILDAMLLLESDCVRHLPVVDDAGRLVGVVTQTDLLAACRAAATTELEAPPDSGS